MLFGLCLQPKKQFNVQIIDILEEIDSFIDQKCTYEKWTTTYPYMGGEGSLGTPNLYYVINGQPLRMQKAYIIAQAHYMPKNA